MNTRIPGRIYDERWLGAMLLAMVVAPLMPRVALAAAPNDANRDGDDAAIRQVVAAFSDGWNKHDAHAMCASVGEDVRWVSWRGEVSESRKAVEENHAMLFADLYKNTHRTDVVKSIRYLGPDLASVDNFWTMTGARTREGADWPYRAGYASFLMAKRAGRWMIIVSHTADFNAKAPADK
ncbi:MAG: hypothetical protein C5B57_01535 [Blastocatellia bacterium]|nr:MAG: hypothetical protein C5B57_01535 [Blastocatellia bacterium]